MAYFSVFLFIKKDSFSKKLERGWASRTKIFVRVKQCVVLKLLIEGSYDRSFFQTYRPSLPFPLHVWAPSVCETTFPMDKNVLSVLRAWLSVCCLFL